MTSVISLLGEASFPELQVYQEPEWKYHHHLAGDRHNTNSNLLTIDGEKH
jgi:hypothetical protein